MPIPYPTASKEDYWPLTAALMGMMNPLLMQKPPFTLGPMEGQLMQRMISRGNTPDTLWTSALRHRIINDAVAGRPGDANELLKLLLQMNEGELAKQLLPGGISTMLGR